MPNEWPDANDPDARRRLEEWSPPGRRATPAEQGFIAQAIFALGEIARCKRLVGVLRAERQRLAGIRWQEQIEDEVRHYERMLFEDPWTATVGLRRSAAGLRYMIACWERLERLLAEEGTWFGYDKALAIQLQGLYPQVKFLNRSEIAYQTWVDCLSAQEHPRPEDIELICTPDYVPLGILERGRPLWQPVPEASRARLKALVARELAALRPLEETMRLEYEEPARAAAKDVALARFPRDEAELVGAVRSHEGAYHRAALALARLARQAAAERRSGAAPRLEAPGDLVDLANSSEPDEPRSGGSHPEGRAGARRTEATAAQVVDGQWVHTITSTVINGSGGAGGPTGTAGATAAGSGYRTEATAAQVNGGQGVQTLLSTVAIESGSAGPWITGAAGSMMAGVAYRTEDAVAQVIEGHWVQTIISTIANESAGAGPPIIGAAGSMMAAAVYRTEAAAAQVDGDNSSNDEPLAFPGGPVASARPGGADAGPWAADGPPGRSAGVDSPPGRA
jgi:hypothetical protein